MTTTDTGPQTTGTPTDRHRIVGGYCFDCAGGCVVDGPSLLRADHVPHLGNHTDYACGFAGPHCWECGEPWPCRYSDPGGHRGMTTTDTGPQTEAGQHYLDQPPGSLDEWERAILAIEAESAGVAGSLRGALAYLLAALDMDSHDPGKRRTVKEAREHAAEAFGATPPPVPTREHVTDADDPLACWCVPYRDSEYPEVIIHRKDDEA